MRTDRVKMIIRALKIQKFNRVLFNRVLPCSFDREFLIYRLPVKTVIATVKKALDAIKRRNIVEARSEHFDMIWHVRAYKMPSPKQLAAFDEIVKAFN